MLHLHRLKTTPAILQKTFIVSSAVCTLFEGDFHHGLAALANSLYRSGFRGTIWAGYRGGLPPWVRDVKGKDGDQSFEAAEGLTIRFLKVETQRHFTNYKPEFMSYLRQNHATDVNIVFYFDPDIVLKAEWKFIEQWADCGVALCEDINSPMHATHPIRLRWSRFCAPHGFIVAREMDVYLNAGFVGVSQINWEFVEIWRRLLAAMESDASGLSKLGISDRSHLFHKPDQDALNMAAMFSSMPVSIVGREGMDFIPGGYLLSHALGTSKPWRKSFIRESLRGYPPTMADHSFMQNTGTFSEMRVNYITEGHATQIISGFFACRPLDVNSLKQAGIKITILCIGSLKIAVKIAP